MKKAVFFFVFLIFCGAAVFYFGWIQFSVPIGMTGVLISKTGGVNELPVENGVFRWQWERLIPTNTQIRSFSKTPITASNQITGELPSAAVYARLVPGKPEFTYDFTVQVTLSAKSSALPVIVSKYNLADQGALENFLMEQAKNISQSAVTFLLSNSVTRLPEFSTEEYITGIDAAALYPRLELIDITVSINKMPDIALYGTAKHAYTVFEDQTRSALVQAAEKHAVSAAEDSLDISRLKNWGELLNQYPIILDFLAVTNGTEQQLAIVESMRKQRQ